MDDSTNTQEPQEGVEFPPDVSQALETIGEALAATVHPLAAALVEQREVTQLLTGHVVALQDALVGVMGFIDRQGVRANWGHDRAVLESARDLIAQLAPGAPDGTPSPEDHT